MKKQLYTAFAFVLFLNFSVNAQLSPGSWAPPFTLTDINGNEYRLYDYLKEGKPVIIDFSAAWCPPCWDQHQSEVLQTIYETYGPNGTDELMVFMIESDPENTTDHLYGLAGPSMGNWVEGTPYPIIDLPDRAVGEAYLQFAYPTIYLICPDFRVAGNMWTPEWSMDYVMDQIAACGGTTPPANDVIVHSYQRNAEDCYTADLFAKIINGGTDPLTEASIKVSRDGSDLMTYEWTGNLGLGEEEEILIEGLELMPNENDFQLSLVDSDEDETNNAIDIPYLKAPDAVQELVVFLGADEFVEEDSTQWRIENENGEVVAESGLLTNNEYTETTVTLPGTGCHTFIITDKGENGLTGTGFVVVSDIDDRLIYDEELFGSEGSAIFLVQEVVGTEEVAAVDAFMIYPNPTKSTALVDLELAEATPVTLRVTSLLGQQMTQRAIGQLGPGQHQFNLNMADWSNGVYLVEVQTESGKVTRKIVKQ